MRRREFVTLLGGAVAWPTTARAQQPDRVRRISILMFLTENDHCRDFLDFKVADYRFHRFIFGLPENIPAYVSLIGDDKIM